MKREGNAMFRKGFLLTICITLGLAGCVSTGPTARWYLLDGRQFDAGKFDRDYNLTCYHAYARQLQNTHIDLVQYLNEQDFNEQCMRRLGWGVVYE